MAQSSPTIIEFPFDTGAYEAADREWLPANLLAVVENLRLDLDGKLGIRPGSTQLAQTTYSASLMTAYDLTNYNGRLVALGDQTTPGFGRPTDVFEFVNNTPAAWRGTAGEDDGFASGPRIPRATAVREVGRLADLSRSVQSVHVACGAGFVCAVVNSIGGDCRIHVFNPVTDQTVAMVTRPLINARVCFAGTDFWVVGEFNINNDIIAYNFDPLTDETVQGPVTISTAPAGSPTDIAVAQTGATDWSVVWAQSTTTTAHRMNAAGTVQATWSVAGGDFRALGICGNVAGTLISILAQRGSDGTYRLNTYTAAGVLSVGPTTAFAGAAGTTHARAGLSQSGTQVMLLGFEDDAPTKNIVSQLMTSQAAHTLASVIRYADALPTGNSAPIVSGGQTNFYYGAQNYMATTITGGVDLLGGGAGSRGTNMLVEAAQVLPQCYKDGTLAASFITVNDMGSTGIIGTKIYWGNLITSNTGGAGFQVTELEMNDTGRRQMACVANELHIAGAMPLVYDGRVAVDQGFAERPALALTAGSAGALTLLGTYFFLAVWEVVDSRGLILRSAPSLAQSVTLTGAQNSVSVVATTPHSLRVHPLFRAGTGLSIRVGIYRTTAGGANYILDNFQEVATAEFGEPTSAIVSARTDAQLTASGIVVYTQAQTPIAHVAPPPYRYTWQARERQLIGGLPNAEQWQFSKLLFPSEPVEFASLGRLGFFGRSNKDITAVGAFETVGITWTSDEISIIPGSGPDHSGLGEFDSALIVPSPGGCRDWRSLVNAPPGFFFQMTEEKLMLLARGQQGGGEVTWAGQPIRQTLALFPVITGAVHIRTQMIVAFSCTNLGGSAGRLLIYDLRRGVWYVDTVGPVTAVSELNGRLAYIQGGLVFLQDAAAGSGTFPGAVVQTGFQAVTKRLGWGHIYKIGLLGTDLGACSVQCLIDVDDGIGLRDLGTETFTGAGLTFERFWSLPTAAQKAARFSVRFVVTSLASGTLAVSLKAWAAEVQGSPNMVRVGSGGFVA
jgi:hypothetical protein